MIGSEEQVRQAEEIRANVIRTMEGIAALLRSVPGYDRTDPAQTGHVEACARRVDAVKNCQYAWDLIECFGGVRFTGDVYADFGALQAAYLSVDTANEARRKLLMRFA